LRSSGVAARVVSSAVMNGVDAFRTAYERAGMNLAQSIVMFTIEMGRRCWRRLRGPRPTTNDQRPMTND
jgi:hypothetical protein